MNKRKWLEILRTRHGFSQEYVSKALGYKASNYGMIENGERQQKMDIELVQKLASVFDVTVEWIIEQETKLKRETA